MKYSEDSQIDQQEQLATESLETENNPVAFAEFSSSNGCDNYQVYNFSVMAIAESFEIKNTGKLAEEDLNIQIVKLKTNSEQVYAISGSGSPRSFLKEKTALIQDMSFTDKTSQYQACLKFFEAISPEHGNKPTEVVDLTSPTEEDIAENNNDILLVKDINKQKKTDDTEMQDDEEHNKQEEELSKDGNK